MRHSLAYRMRDVNGRVKDGTRTSIKVSILKALEITNTVRVLVEELATTPATETSAEAFIYKSERLVQRMAELQLEVSRMRGFVDAYKSFVPIATTIETELANDPPECEELCDAAHLLQEHFHRMGDEKTVEECLSMIRRLTSVQPV